MEGFTFYTGDEQFDLWLAIGFAFAFCAVIGCLFVSSPYGKFADSSMGVELDPRLGWWLMELPATVSFWYFYPKGEHAWEVPRLFFALYWTKHYLNRGWYFPLSIRVAPGRKSSFGLLVMACGMFMTSFHGFLNARWFSQFADHLTVDWFKNPIFIGGFLLYELSFWFTVQSESIVRNLRGSTVKKGEPRYKIPYGGGFKYVSSPAYLGELLGWLGWTIMTLNPGGLVVFLISAANLVPRAFQTHRWYREKFEDYPTDRKALIPHVI
mmetsp:Transcript_7149/g.11372  ORF Transcript_7149/g.11372 Transcript_7149/m.11372 type:complete len:267 (+) Transcript_7149:163-963(+)